MVRRNQFRGPFGPQGPFWALCMFWLISYGAPEGVPQDIGPGYLVDDLLYVVAGKQGTPRDTLRTRRFPKEPSYMSPMAAPCARPPVQLEGSLGNPLGLDSGPAGSLESDLVAEPVPVPVAIPHVLARRVAVRVRDRAGLVPKLSGPIWYGDGSLTTVALPPFPPPLVPQGALVSKVSSKSFF